MQVRNKFFPATEIGERPSALLKKTTLSISKDGNGTEIFSISSTDRQNLLSAIAGSEYTVSNSIQLKNGTSVELPSYTGYRYFNLPIAATVTITGGSWQLFNMGDKEQQVTFTSEQSLAKGYYRLQATSATAVNLSYSYGIGSKSIL